MADPFDTPGYRFAVNNFPGDGSTTDWNIDFAGRTPGYISIDHVRAALIDDATGEETPVLLGPENFILPTRIRVTPAVPVGVTLRVWRDTPKDQPMLDYTDGALMIERNLDTSNEQSIYNVAEMVDRFADALDATNEFSQAVLDRLADVENTANEAHDTADTALDTSNTALSAANSAVQTAADALAGVEGATQAAIDATNAANAANAAAATATTAADNANQAATDATDTAAQAVTIAQNAETVANGIDAKAQLALDTAEAAETTANNAETVANGIDAKATQAQSDAAVALANATTAMNTAYLRRGQLPADTTHNLNSYTVPDSEGTWYQYTTDYASLAQNYPIALAGTLEVLRWKRGSDSCIQRYTSCLDGGDTANEPPRVFVRRAANATAWSPWVELDTVTARNLELDNYSTTAEMTTAIAAALEGYATEIYVGDQLALYTPLQNLQWLSKPIGEPFPLWDHIPGCPIPPADNPNFRFIKLTAGDAYNDGVLTAESVSGSAPLVIATAQISLSASPMNGQTVQLINTERRALRAGESGVVQQDAFQGHRHKFAYDDLRLTGTGSGGMVNGTIDTLSNDNVYDPITDGVNGEPRTANETRMKNVGATYYMRIR